MDFFTDDDDNVDDGPPVTIETHVEATDTFELVSATTPSSSSSSSKRGDRTQGQRLTVNKGNN